MKENGNVLGTEPSSVGTPTTQVRVLFTSILVSISPYWQCHIVPLSVFLGGGITFYIQDN